MKRTNHTLSMQLLVACDQSYYTESAAAMVGRALAPLPDRAVDAPNEYRNPDVYQNEPRFPVASGYKVFEGIDQRFAIGGQGFYVKDFGDGELGITLEDAPPIPAPTLDRGFLGDLVPDNLNPATDGVQTGVDEFGNLITDPNRANPDSTDFLNESAGNDDLFGYDYLDGYEGNLSDRSANPYGEIGRLTTSSADRQGRAENAEVFPWEA